MSTFSPPGSRRGLLPTLLAAVMGAGLVSVSPLAAQNATTNQPTATSANATAAPYTAISASSPSLPLPPTNLPYSGVLPLGPDPTAHGVTAETSSNTTSLPPASFVIPGVVTATSPGPGSSNSTAAAIATGAGRVSNSTITQENQAAARDIEAIMAGKELGPVQQKPGALVSLQSAIDQSLHQNLGLNIQRYQPSIAADTVEQARSAFDPVVGAGGSYTQGSNPVPGALISETQDLNASVTQRISTGATVQVSNDLNRQYNPNTTPSTQYAGSLGVTVAQPLLRGFGSTVNLAPIVLARASYQQSLLELQRQAFDVISETEIAYWNLSAAYVLRTLRETNYKLAQTVLRQAQARQDAGYAVGTDVLQAKASLASRYEEIITAQQTIEDAEDRLRSFMGSLEFEPSTTLSVAPLPDLNPILPEFRAVTQAALAFDMDSQIQYIEIEKRRLQSVVARNENRPNLDLTISGASLGNDPSGSKAYADSLKFSGYSWTAGLQFTMPIGMRDANARERQANKNLQSSSLQMAVIQQELMLRLRSAWRAIDAARQRRITTRAALDLNAQAFSQESARYEAGLSIFLNVLEAQRNLDNARVDYLQATLDLIRACVSLDRMDGALLLRHGFEWHEIVPQARPQVPAAPKPIAPAPGTGPSDSTTPASAILKPASTKPAGARP